MDKKRIIIFKLPGAWNQSEREFSKDIILYLPSGLYIPEREATVLNETLGEGYQLEGTRGWRGDLCPAKTLFDPYFVVITNFNGG